MFFKTNKMQQKINDRDINYRRYTLTFFKTQYWYMSYKGHFMYIGKNKNGETTYAGWLDV